MQTKNLQQAIVNYTAQTSGHDEHRPYIGLSGIGDCERIIYNRFFFGERRPDVGWLLTTKISYELEAALIKRLTAIGVYSSAEPIILFDGQVQGHPDGIISGADFLEIKTVAMEEHFPENNIVSRRIFWQCQGYMHFGKRDLTHVVYLARSTGAIHAVGLRYQEKVGRELEAKVRRLVEAVRERKQPGCMCGKCGTVKDEKPVVTNKQ